MQRALFLLTTILLSATPAVAQHRIDLPWTHTLSPAPVRTAQVGSLDLLTYTPATETARNWPAQGAVTLSGRVVFAGTHGPLADATVWIDGVATEARTNAAGEFVLADAPIGVVTVRTRRIGFYPGRGTVRLTGSPGERVEIGLDPVLLCFDACDPAPAPTSGYVRVVR